MMKKLISFFFLALLAMGLIVTKPSSTDFARWFIEETEISSPLNDLLEEVIIGDTECHDYMFVATFTYQDKTFIGVADHIFGSSEIKTLAETVTETVTDAVKEAADESGK